MKKLFIIFPFLLLSFLIVTADPKPKQQTIKVKIKKVNIDSLLKIKLDSIDLVQKKYIIENIKANPINVIPKNENNFWKFWPFITAILVFFLGQFAIFFRDWLVEKRRIKAIRKYFFVCLINFRTGLTGQLTIFNNLLNALEEDNKIRTSILRFVIQQNEVSTKQILGIEVKDVFNFFVIKPSGSNIENIRPVLFNSFYSRLELVKEIHESIDEINEMLRSQIQKNIDHIYTNHNSIGEMILNEQQAIVSGIKVTNPYYEELHKAYTDYLKVDETLDNMQTKLMEPFHEISKKHFVYPESLKYILFTTQAKACFEEILETKKLFTVRLNDWKKYYESMEELAKQVMVLEFSDLKREQLKMQNKLQENRQTDNN